MSSNRLIIRHFSLRQQLGVILTALYGVQSLCRNTDLTDNMLCPALQTLPSTSTCISAHVVHPARHLLIGLSVRSASSFG
ncbi:hypothetical protein TNCV_2105941 [Trichonephila clavipes]|nr:hypothetical protein TNCV_2105941 [Trichonephila clavipes]